METKASAVYSSFEINLIVVLKIVSEFDRFKAYAKF